MNRIRRFGIYASITLSFVLAACGANDGYEPKIPGKNAGSGGKSGTGGSAGTTSLSSGGTSLGGSTSGSSGSSTSSGGDSGEAGSTPGGATNVGGTNGGGFGGQGTAGVSGVSGTSGNAGAGAGAGGSSGSNNAGEGGTSANAGASGTAGVGGIELSDVLAGYAFDAAGPEISDFSGNNHTALVGPTRLVPGKTNNAASLDGFSGYVSLPAEIASSLNDFSVSIWVKPTRIESWMRVFDFGNGTDKYVMLSIAAKQTGKPRFSIKNGGAEEAEQVVDSSVALKIDTWQHLAVTQAGDKVSMYIDGALVGSSEAVTLRASTFSSAKSWLGRSQWPDPLYAGAYDEFALYSRALTLSEVTTLAAGGDAGTTGLVVGYHFDETASYVLADFSGKNQEGQLVSGVSLTTGKRADAVILDGSVGYVELPQNILSGVTDFTVAAWVKQNAMHVWSRVFDFGEDTNNYMMLSLASSRGQFLRFVQKVDGGVEQFVDGPVVPVGSWQHIAVTRAGTQLALYLNGKSVGAGVVSGYLAGPNLTKHNFIGRSQWPDPLLDGAVDDFRIYARALKPAEINALSSD